MTLLLISIDVTFETAMINGGLVVIEIMRELIFILKDFGFSKKEADVYLAVLEFGEAQVSDIAKKAKLPRTSCYEVIKVLKSRHMISYYVKKRTRLYVAEDPQKIVSFFEHRAGFFRALLPRLSALGGKAGAKPVIRLYEGEQGLKTILDEVIDEKRNFDAITCIDDAITLFEGKFEDFMENRRKHFLHVRLLTVRSKHSEKLKVKDAEELRETRFVPEEYKFDTANWIFGDKVALLLLKKERAVGLVIQDENIADTFRMYFELMWQNVEKS